MQQKSASILANASLASAKRAAGGRPSQSPASCNADGLGSTSPANSIRSRNGCQTSRIQREPMAPAPSIRQRYLSLMTASSQVDYDESADTERVPSRGKRSSSHPWQRHGAARCSTSKLPQLTRNDMTAAISKWLAASQPLPT